MIHVVAIVTTKPGQRGAVLDALRANLPAVRAEAGCIEYGPVVDAAASRDRLGDDTFVVVEKWESAEALAAHAVAPHMAAYAAQVTDMLASRKVHVLAEA